MHQAIAPIAVRPWTLNGLNVTRALRAHGLDARYVRGGLSAWYAAGGARAMRLPERDA